MRQFAVGIACLGLLALAIIGVLRAHRPVARDIAPACQRLADPEPQPAQTEKKVKLGASTRSAIAAAPESPFELDIDSGAAYLDLSIGAAKLAATSAGIRFDISDAADRSSQPIFSEAVKPGMVGWVDHRLDLRKLTARPRRLRFAVARVEGSPGQEEEAYWGSLRLVGCASAAASPPNVILISLDTLGADHLSAFGNAYGVSPNIDAFLQQAFSFRRAYVQFPNTLVSHASIMTGLYPLHHGVYEESPTLPARTLASILAAHGYITAAFTEDAFVSSEFGFDHGFDGYDNGDATNERGAMTGNAAVTFAKAADWIDRWGRDTRFLLFVHTYEVHAPYTPRDDQAMRIANQIDPDYHGPYEKAYPAGLPAILNNSGKVRMSDKDRARAAALYAGEINYLDRVVAKFLAHLSASPIAADTLVVLTADHGDEFGEHGMLGHGETLFNHVLHVPLGFYWPGHTVAGTYALPVQSIDILPTVLDVLQIKQPDGLDGISHAGLILGREHTQPSRPAYAELDAIAFAAQRAAQGRCWQFGLPPDCRVDRRAIQTERFKLIRSKFPPYENLYDLQNDPGETRDVAAQYPDELQRLRALLITYDSGRAAAPAAPPAAPTIDAATRERLRALGYVK